jgi:hypothetical protein
MRQWQSQTWSFQIRFKRVKLKHGRHKWQMRTIKKMVDGDVCVSVMASNLCQQHWPPICVNKDGLSEEVLTMASLAHSAHRHSICAGKAIQARSLLEGPLAYGEGTLGMGTINEGTSQGNINRFW